MLDLLSLLKDLEVPASEPCLLIVPLNKETQGTIDYQFELNLEDPIFD
jgi:hypothetical protein